MAEIAQPKPVKLIVGLLAQQSVWLDAAGQRLTETLGPIDLTSQDIDFTFTHYYDQQMGAGLLRRFLAFERLIDPGELRAIKQRTNQLEAELARQFPQVARPVNLDPGYVALAKLVLASAKDFSHRVYLGEGIFAEITLQFREGKWQSLAWTFPDYGSGQYDAFLLAARQRLKEQLDAGA